MERRKMWCECMGVRRFRDAISDIAEETKELFEVKSLEELKDELSDISWGIGRLLAGIFGKEYIRIVGDRRHYKKVVMRMKTQGCVRSERRVREGKGCV